MSKKLLLAIATLGVVVIFLFVTAASARTNYVTIGTGGVTGVYYPTGSAIASVVNKKRNDHKLLITVESTDGSVYNVNAISSGELEFGVIQSDRQFQAYNGTADWEGRPQQKLRAVFSIHPESVIIVAAADKNIKTVADLKGKIVNIGNVGSGQRGNALDLLAAAEINYKTDLTAKSMVATESARMLQDGKIDAFIYTVGHPNGSVKEAVAGARKVNFAHVPAAVTNKLTDNYSYYAASEIPVDLYPGVANAANVQTFGVMATFCTSVDVADEVVYAITKEVFEGFDEFKQLHPAFSTLTKQGMLQGLSAPIHSGAMKYFKEVGLR